MKKILSIIAVLLTTITLHGETAINVVAELEINPK